MICIIISENYYLLGNTVGKYSLSSPIQREEGKRWFYPHFGFAYKLVNANVKVVFISGSTQLVVLDKTDNVLNDNWQYFFTNLSDVNFLNTAWTDSDEAELFWQILLLFDVSAGGSVSVDNIGKYF